MDRIIELLNKEEPLTWIFYGDSITHGGLHTMGWRDYTEIFAERVRYEMERVQDIIINSAIRGNTTRDLIEGFEWRVGRFKPDIVFIMIGMNDSNDQRSVDITEYSRNLNEIVKYIQNIGAIPILQTTCTVMPNEAPHHAPNLPSYMEEVRKLSLKENLPLIDHTKIWDNLGDKVFFWLNNAIHPNQYGHRAFAYTIFEHLNIIDQDKPCCRLLIP